MTEKTCSVCAGSFPATAEFFRKERPDRYGTLKLSGQCKECRRKKEAARRAANPNRKADDKAVYERWKARGGMQRKLTANMSPEQLQRQRENRRIAYRLRREREGVSLADQRRNGRVSTVVVGDPVGYIVAKPLYDFVMGEMNARGEATVEFCTSIGINARRLYDWGRPKARLQVALAITVMDYLDTFWEEVWSENPEAVRQYFQPQSYIRPANRPAGWNAEKVGISDPSLDLIGLPQEGVAFRLGRKIVTPRFAVRCECARPIVDDESCAKCGKLIPEEES